MKVQTKKLTLNIQHLKKKLVCFHQERKQQNKIKVIKTTTIKYKMNSMRKMQKLK